MSGRGSTEPPPSASEPKAPARLFVEHRPAEERRRRVAPIHETTSDERRFSGIAVAVVVGAVATLAAVGLTTTPAALRSPGPLSRPHVGAELSCAQCHTPNEQPVVAACVGCHGPHPSTRNGHRKLAAAGTLKCTSCHRIHRDDGGVAIADDGSLTRFGPGAQTRLTASAPGVAPGIVPVVPAEACRRCHELDAPRDPIQRCMLRGTDVARPELRPTVCFDEHRTMTGAALTSDAKLRTRIGQWAAARTALAEAPVAPSAPDRSRPGWWLLAVGLGTSVVMWLGWRSIDGALAARRRRRARARIAAGAAAEPATVRKLPAIDASTCIGCYACVDACPYDVLAVQDYVAKVVRPDDCCGLTLCEQRCPNGSLKITEGDAIGDRPRIDARLQSSDTPGLFLAGDVTGLPLIRNAIAQGQLAIEAVAASLDPRARPTGPTLDVAIVGAGPAGLSAALAAQAAGLRYVVLEQGSMAESIRSFPRGKLVFDQPLGLPLVGKLWLRESTKEELLSKWTRIVREHALPIREGVRVTDVTRSGDGDGFVIGLHAGAPVSARRVVLAMGRRGTPRRLPVPIPDAAMDGVHYHLADARTFAGRRVLVVGLGDVAMEAAIALAQQPDTTVTVSYRGADFHRGKQRNIDRLRRLADAGRVAIRWQTEVEAVTAASVTLSGAGARACVEVDAVFVLIGAIAPWDFLARAGVSRADTPAQRPVDRPHLPVLQ